MAQRDKGLESKNRSHQKTQAPSISKMEQLNSGLLILGIKKQTEEPEYHVLDRQTFTHHHIQTKQIYSNEIVRVFNELKLTTELLSKVEVNSEAESPAHKPEELINYYSGIFFELVHQLKDKLLQLISAMIIDLDTPLSRKYRDLSSEEKKKFLDTNTDKLKEIGIYEALVTWKIEEGPIGLTLHKRTKHHHFQSRLALNEDFQKLKMSRIMTEGEASNQLSEYGKKRMTEIFELSFKNLKEGTVKKQQNTIHEIEANLETIAEKLIMHYKVPTDIVELAKITNDWMEKESSLKVTNESSLSKITPELKKMVDVMMNEAIKNLGDQVVSVYLVGSIGRGEFIPGTSDINLYIITKGYTQIFNTHEPATISMLSEDDFLSEGHKKDRFICWSDGVLLAGKKFEFNGKEFPKPGAILALLLNKGFIERIETLKQDVVILKSPSNVQLRLYSIQMARILLDYCFGVAMTNTPFYTASRKKKIAYVKESFPSDYLILTLEQVYNGSIVKQEDFSLIIDAFLGSNRKNYQKLLDIVKESSTDTYTKK